MMRFSFDHWSLDLLGGCFGIAIGLGLVRFDFGIIGSLMVDANWINIEDIGRHHHAELHASQRSKP